MFKKEIEDKQKTNNKMGNQIKLINNFKKRGNVLGKTSKEEAILINENKGRYNDFRNRKQSLWKALFN